VAPVEVGDAPREGDPLRSASRRAPSREPPLVDEQDSCVSYAAPDATAASATRRSPGGRRSPPREAPVEIAICEASGDQAGASAKPCVLRVRFRWRLPSRLARQREAADAFLASAADVAVAARDLRPALSDAAPAAKTSHFYRRFDRL
jgi:hypothetical protein